MREILFRGKSVDTGRWAFGNLVIQETDNSEVNFITNNETVVDVFIQPIKKVWENHWNSFGRQEWKAVSPMLKVDPATVGQYTGLTDKNGKKIFDGDILKGDEYPYKSSDGTYNYYAEVVWFDDSPAFGLYTFKNPQSKVTGISSGLSDYIEDFAPCMWEVIGNIHDNPELMGGTENVSHP